MVGGGVNWWFWRQCFICGADSARARGGGGEEEEEESLFKADAGEGLFKANEVN